MMQQTVSWQHKEMACICVKAASDANSSLHKEIDDCKNGQNKNYEYLIFISV